MGLLSLGLLSLGLGALGGCSAKSVDLGDGALGVDRSALSSYTAVWTGYLEGVTLDSGSDFIQVVIDSDGGGELSFGDGTPPELPSDADDPPLGWQERGIDSDFDAELLVEAASYDFNEPAVVEANRIRVSASTLSLHAQYCAMQAPIADATEPGRYACAPNVGYSRDASGCRLSDGTEYSCAKLEFCQAGLCQCDAESCSVTAGTNLRLDAALDDSGTRLEGTLNAPIGRGIQVRMVRQ